MKKRQYKDFIITVLVFTPGIVPRIAQDLSRVTFAGLSNVDAPLVADLAVQAGYSVFIIEADQVYIGVQFYDPKPRPAVACLAPVAFNQYLFSDN